jgi:hypothetical protein
MYIKPIDKYDKYFRRLLKSHRVDIDDISIVRNMPRKYPELFDKNNGFMDIGRIDRTRTSMLVLRPNTGIAPIYPPSSKKGIKYKFFRIF